MLTQNSYGSIIQHWMTLVQLLESGDTYQASAYVAESIHAPLSESGLGVLGSKVVEYATYGFLPVNSNPSAWIVESGAQLQDEISLDDTRMQTVQARKNVKVKNHTLRAYILQLSKSLESRAKGATNAQIENETNRQFNASMVDLQDVELTTEQKADYKRRLKARVKQQLTPTDDSLIAELETLAFALVIYYRFNPDVSPTEIRNYIGVYHDGLWADSIMAKHRLKIAQTDEGVTVQAFGQEMIARSKAIGEKPKAQKSADKVKV
jgi:flagellar motor protein MotB